MRISFATQTDVPIVLELIRGLAEYEKLTHTVVASEERLRKTLFGEHPAAEVLLAHWEYEPAAFAVFFSTYSTFLAQPGLYLEDVYVKPHLRGNGIGLALLKRVAAIATERGCGRVEWSVLDWNAPAIGFYKKLGAVPLDDWTMFRLEGRTLEAFAASSSVLSE